MTDPVTGLTPEARADLRAAAEKATPGPWEFCPLIHGDPLVAEMGRQSFGAVAMCSTRTDDYGRANAEFIAATDPAVVLLLLDMLDAAERDRDRAEARATSWAAEAGEREAERDSLQRQLDDAHRRLDEIASVVDSLYSSGFVRTRIRDILAASFPVTESRNERVGDG